MSKSRIQTDIDFSKDGRQVGYLRLPHSVHRSAYGYLAIPIAVIKNGGGPTLLAMSGNHGDEYEGQVANSKLIRRLDARDVHGRVIVLPAANFPAAMAGTRTSPIDGGNLNRVFPGDRDGTPTWMISHYIETVLFPMADLVLDIHSGGSSLLYLPSAIVHETADEKRAARLMEMLEVFGAPMGLVFRTPKDDRTAPSAAERVGTIRLGTELGGAGMVGVESTQIAEAGIQRILEHLGILKQSQVSRPRTKTRIMDVRDAYYVFSQEHGLFEPYVDLGTVVNKGQEAGAVHFIDNPLREPVLAHFAHHGMVVCKRVPGLVERGDCLFHLATDRS
jgi:predicted deacylase